MAAKEVKFSTEARDKMLHGIDILANAVKVTFGPKGRVTLDKSFGAPRITKDGVAVVKEIELEDNVGEIFSPATNKEVTKSTFVRGPDAAACFIVELKSGSLADEDCSNRSVV